MVAILTIEIVSKKQNNTIPQSEKWEGRSKDYISRMFSFAFLLWNIVLCSHRSVHSVYRALQQQTETSFDFVREKGTI